MEFSPLIAPDMLEPICTPYDIVLDKCYSVVTCKLNAIYLEHNKPITKKKYTPLYDKS